METEYNPELGQAIFGQPPQSLSVSPELECAVSALQSIWDVVRSDEDNPFNNTGATFDHALIQIHSYSWDDESEQTWNLKWRDLRVSWYKYCGRGMSVNRTTTKSELRELVADGFAAIMDKKSS